MAPEKAACLSYLLRLTLSGTREGRGVDLDAWEVGGQVSTSSTWVTRQVEKRRWGSQPFNVRGKPSLFLNYY